ncbi:YkuS family protein [Clostridium polynesiense]|uniref:YkuS family protein n=1 Tax=Clostridium polynesiense TaxID=1325933 RepID=UPI00058D6927|nr:YkuS family protein [Clostridium polynesiense]
MNIYVCPGLEDIKDELKKRGYIINDNRMHPYDAIICNIKETDLASLNILTNVKNEGTLIIDAGSKSVNDIEYILNNRAYSSLF